MGKVFWRSLFFGVALASFTVLLTPLNASETAVEQQEPEKGPHRGRLLTKGDFVIELAIFETGVPPEFRVWVTNEGQLVNPEDVSLTVELTRLGNVVDTIRFKPQGDFLRGDMEIYEPHSFVVTITAEYQGKTFEWQYDNFEGRTMIDADVAEAMQIATEVAGPAKLTETVHVFGRLVAPTHAARQITARFEGQISSVHVQLGQRVKAGEPLLTIESNESLKPFTVAAPINGVVVARHANPGEQTNGRVLLSLLDTSVLNAELGVFPLDRQRVTPGARVRLTATNGGTDAIEGSVASIDTQVQPNQSTLVRVAIDNTAGRFSNGQFVSGEIEVAQYDVPLAVKRSGLQGFRDFTVVFAKIGNEYEVRMLELGREAGAWVEVLGGLAPGTEYVSGNSYVIKADIEKSGASHDH
jgi:cobalt-zinc-cadmium efflux system membrane fusion protein